MNYTIALVGKPNSGKTTLFNNLTGAKQKVANYPGVTVERKEGRASIDDKEFVIFDLPGTYSLSADSLDEKVTCDFLSGNIDGLKKPDFIVCVADATNLRLSLRLIIETIALGIPLIVAVNKIDVAEKRGINISVEKLSAQLGVTVVAINSKDNDSKEKILLTVIKSAKGNKDRAVICDKTCSHQCIDQIVKQVVINKGRQDKLTSRLDKILLHPFWGAICFLSIIFIMFQSVFSFASVPMDMIDGAIGSLSEMLNNQLPDGMFKDMLTNGVISGVGSVLIFLPQIIILFFFIILIESSGYMARVAFLLDRVMGGVGLQGKSFIPLMSSFACAIPGIMATRTIENPADRLITILIAPLITCSARLPVYTLIIAAFIPKTTILGYFSLQGIVLFSLYIIGIFSAMLVAFILRKAVFKGKREPLLMEMPDYQVPRIRDIALLLLERVKIFINRAGRIIFPLMIIVWFLSSYPSAPDEASGAKILHSFAGMIGSFFAPIFAPLGFNWQMVVALIPGMAAREVSIGVLATVYAVSSDGNVDSLAAMLASQWSLPTALSFLTWYIFAPQCLPTIGVIKRETNGWLWPSVTLIYLFTLAYLFSMLVFNISSSVFG